MGVGGRGGAPGPCLISRRAVAVHLVLPVAVLLKVVEDQRRVAPAKVGGEGAAPEGGGGVGQRVLDRVLRGAPGRGGGLARSWQSCFAR